MERLDTCPNWASVSMYRNEASRPDSCFMVPPTGSPVGPSYPTSAGRALEDDVEVLPPGRPGVVRGVPLADDAVPLPPGDEALVEVRIHPAHRPLRVGEDHGEHPSDAPVVVVQRGVGLPGVAV